MACLLPLHAVTTHVDGCNQSITLARGARQLVVQLALDTTSSFDGS